MNLSESSDPGALIIAYRRPENLQNILEQCVASGIKRIYITVDSPRSNTRQELSDVQKVKNVIHVFKSQVSPQIEVHSRAALRNLGCAVSVLSGCDWAFRREKELIVIEDDCIPSKPFFDFAKDQIGNIDLCQSLILVCGTQVAPNSLTGESGLLSRYPLTWGWGTNKATWKEIRKLFVDARLWKIALEDLFALTPETSYWRAAKRRALVGFTDVWDSVVVEFMQREHLLAILPPHNLILNNGNDSVATNVPSDSEWTNKSVASGFIPKKDNLLRRLDVEFWIRKYCYGISARHLFSTKLTFLLDILFIQRRKFRKPLNARLLEAGPFEKI